MGVAGGGKLNSPVDAAFGHHFGNQEFVLLDLLWGSREVKVLHKVQSLLQQGAPQLSVQTRQAVREGVKGT